MSQQALLCDVFDPWLCRVSLGSESLSAGANGDAGVWKAKNLEIWGPENQEI